MKSDSSALSSNVYLAVPPSIKKYLSVLSSNVITDRVTDYKWYFLAVFSGCAQVF